MIQRIQTLHLILSAIVGIIAIVMTIQNTELFSPTATWISLGYNILLGLSIAIAIWAIFLYTNRKKQMRIVKLSITAIILAYTLLIIGQFTVNTEATPWTSVALYLPLVSLILNILAKNRIQYDENLVRSADRLR